MAVFPFWQEISALRLVTPYGSEIAFTTLSNWARSEKDLREVRQKITFAVYAQEDDLDKVTAAVDHLLTLLMKAQGK